MNQHFKHVFLRSEKADWIIEKSSSKWTLLNTNTYHPVSAHATIELERIYQEELQKES